MNLKLKATLTFIIILLISALLTTILLSAIWLLIRYPIIIGIGIIAILLSIFWKMIYDDLKEEI